MIVINHGAAVGLFGHLTLTPGLNDVDRALWSRLSKVLISVKGGEISYVDALLKAGRLEIAEDTPPPIEIEQDASAEASPPRKKRGRKKKK